MLAQDGGNGVRGTEKKVSVSVSVSVTENDGAAASPPAPSPQTAGEGNGECVKTADNIGEKDTPEKTYGFCHDGNDAAGNGIPALQERPQTETADLIYQSQPVSVGTACATRGAGEAPVFRMDHLTPEQQEKLMADIQSMPENISMPIVVDDATPGENFYKRLEALLTGNGPACYIIGEFGGEFFVRLQRSPDPTLAGHGRTITEALSSLLDCAQAEQTAIGLAKAGEF